MTNEELQQQIEQLEQQIKDLKVKLEEKAEKKPYEVEVPDDIEDYYYVEINGGINLVGIYSEETQKEIYKRGLAFKTRAEAERYDKERILINKLNDWDKEHNGGWKLNWEDENEKYYISYRVQDKILGIFLTRYYSDFRKLPYFKSEEIAEQFVEEFGDEIKEVLC